MRFLMLTTTYPSPRRPTAGTFNRSLAEALADEHEVKVVAPRQWTDAFLARLPGVGSAEANPSAVPIEVLRPLYLYPPRIFRNQYGRFMRASVRRELRSLFARFRPDVVIGYWAHPDGEVAVAAARDNNAVALVVVGGSDVLLLARNARRRRVILDVLRSADAVLAVGSALRDRVIELGVPGERVHVFQQGVDLALFSPGDRGTSRRRLGLREDGAVVLWVGRMVGVKALDVLIAAGARLRARGVEFHLYLIGDGPLADRVRSWIRDANCEAVMHVVGAVDQAKLPDWYRAADVTVLPSHSEGVPNVLLESLACGTPFIATSVGAIPEIVREPSELVPADPEALAAALARRLSSGAVPLERTAQMSWADSASSIVALVGSLRERAGQGGGGRLARHPSANGILLHARVPGDVAGPTGRAVSQARDLPRDGRPRRPGRLWNGAERVGWAGAEVPITAALLCRGLRGLGGVLRVPRPALAGGGGSHTGGAGHQHLPAPPHHIQRRQPSPAAVDPPRAHRLRAFGWSSREALRSSSITGSRRSSCTSG